MDYSFLIDLLRLKQEITPLEKDILDTWNELQKNPFDMDSANKQILSNKISHPDIALMVNALPTTIAKPQNQVTEVDNRYILQCQLAFLAGKEMEEQGYGK